MAKKRFVRSKPNSSKPSAAKPGAPLRLYGMHTVIAALDNPKRKKKRLLLTPNAHKRLTEMTDLGRHHDLDIDDAEPKYLDKLVGPEAVHQGIVLECDPILPLTLDTLVPGGMLVALDQISDPHNVGAIMRSCVAMGIEGLIVTTRNTAPETAVLAKSASGALDMIDIYHSTNLSKSLRQLANMGYHTIGLDSEAESNINDALPTGPKVLVLGAEGKGLRQQTREQCTLLTRLDMPGPIKSLNVSNAAILALYVLNTHG